MLKILKIKISGYKRLEDNFTLDLVSKARVYQEDKEKEVEEIDEGLYVFRTISIVGGNSSGKTSVLSLILKVLYFLNTGRWVYLDHEFKKEVIDLELTFYLDGYLYFYKGSLDGSEYKNSKIKPKVSFTNTLFANVINEELKKIKYNKKYIRLSNLDLISVNALDVSKEFASNIKDTSLLGRIDKEKIIYDDFTSNNITSFHGVFLGNTFIDSLKSISSEFLAKIVNLLDESIEYIHSIPTNDEYVKFKRINEKEVIISIDELMLELSSGTFKGIGLYIKAILALKYGAYLVVDEIENSFHKNLVSNLLFLFNDKNVNKKKATLIFSTHYVEILDFISRRDSIYITHKNDLGFINIKNLFKDYNYRTEISKSNLFNNNVFNTSINYKKLVELKEKIKDEV